MNKNDLKNIVVEMVANATILKNKHTDEKDAPVNYACIFCQSDNEFELFFNAAEKLGYIIKETPTGLLFHIEPIETVSGQVKLLKIRNPDETRSERGYADFTVGYVEFKKKYLGSENFKLIIREDSEMIELMDSAIDVRVYFPDLPLDKELSL